MDPLGNKLLPSGLLSPQENQKVCKLLAEKVQSVSTAVVQLYVTQNTRWQYFLTGVACLVKASTSLGQNSFLSHIHIFILVWFQEYFEKCQVKN